ncbi:MAG: adenylyltransferase/cytidyltransferase family protein [Rubrivivax sp.]|nr:adenylyltransferase/cytidyltransferase family protein [Rubrivivax sp.]MBK7262946.1 adenylyltransferase/cytidyltransferase family protein [Rubrivivax sp.]MBK8529118.1 adenylyltransferase/cytidyltransferase family protein [Rubrivivax sp.]
MKTTAQPHRPQLRAAPDARSGTALTYGTYDLFHVGHVRLFRRIKERYGFLVVAVSTDEFNAIKGKRSTVPFEDRIEIVRACRYVDLAIAESDWAQKEHDIREYGISAFVMGDDWSGKFDHLRSLCQVLYLPRTTGISSTALKAGVKVGAAVSAV